MKHINIEELKKAASQVKSWGALIKQIGVKSRGRVMQLCVEHDIDTTHFMGKSWSKGMTMCPKTPINMYLENRQPTSTVHLKHRLICEGIKKAECESCKMSEWMGKPIKLTLHHINGNSKDNVLTNLQVLCPNCHAMTENFAGRNRRIQAPVIRYVTDEQIIEAIQHTYNRHQALTELGLCGKGQGYTRITQLLEKRPDIKFLQVKPLVKLTVSTAWRHRPRPKQRKVLRPSREELEKMVWDKPTTTIAAQLGVSDKAVAAWCKRYNINKPPRGHWAKQKAAAG